MKKIYLSIALLSIISIFFNASAQYTYSDGNGTSGNPYQIKSPDDLNGVRDYLNDENICFIVMQDIDLTDFLVAKGGNGWDAIGPDLSYMFKGTFDGNGKTISNLKYTGGGGGFGLFGRLSTPGVIKNLTMDNATIQAGSWSGILVSTNGTGEYAGGTISNCVVKNSTITGELCVGGIAGVNSATIENSAAVDVSVSGTGKSIGGLVGENGRAASLIKGCYSSGSVSGADEVGGLVGQHTGDTQNAIENSYSFAYVYGGTNVGGLIGYCNGTVKNCFASGDVEGISAGGLIGAPLTKNIENCYATGNVLGVDGQDSFNGGLNGAAYSCSFTNCYFNGTLEGKASDRAITGRAINLAFTNCYFNSTSAGCTTGYQDNENSTGTIAALTDTEMKQAANFTGLLADASWMIWEGNSAPYFVTQSAPPVLTAVRTNIISGTYLNTPESIKIYTVDNMDVEISDLQISSGTWNATIASGEIAVGDYVNVILKESGKAYSYAVYDVADVPSGIKEKAAAGISVYKDPESNYIAVTAEGKVQVDVYDASGKKALPSCFIETSGEISTNNLPEGIYFVRVISSQGDCTEKIWVK